ncbi:hypothetical protein GQ600_27264 [Phytophthora cactorum]|nr:hypothetical protein GQ600_27264 [Phytophthora cactorum]
MESRTHSPFRFQAYPASRNDKICGFLFESNLHEVFKGEVERKIDFEPSSQSQVSSVEELPVAASDKRRVESSLSIRSEVVNCSDSDDVPLAVVVSGLNKTKRRKKINPRGPNPSGNERENEFLIPRPPEMRRRCLTSSVEELPVAASDKRRVESSLSIRSEVVNCSDSDDVPLAVVVSGLNKTKRRKKINPRGPNPSGNDRKHTTKHLV